MNLGRIFWNNLINTIKSAILEAFARVFFSFLLNFLMGKKTRFFILKYT